ncbi:unnamed protein product [Ambrosiozyma monospora]|uniref:Unnamed protein product n=1 Tax=Ambrosiozyma monospora TaxID=43982 RepID=A0A9W6T831_AMBMO|nr:unnamed protein product [Ambrosiozyma monospora]
MSKPRQIHFQLGNLITSLNQNSIYYPIENDDGIFQLMNLDTSAYPEDDYYYDDDDDDDFDMDELHASSNEGLIHHSSSDINSNTNTNNTSRGSGTNNGNSITAPTTQPQSPSISSPFYQTSVVLEMSPNFKVSTLTSNKTYICAGSVDGSLSTYVPSTGMHQEYQLTYEDNGITNFILPSKTSYFNDQLIVASNDNKIRHYDVTKRSVSKITSFDYAINCMCENPQNGNLVMMVGDSTRWMIVDKRSPGDFGNGVIGLYGTHLDFGFACDWNSDGVVMASGNQDGLLKLYDFRKLDQELITLSGCNHGAVRNLKFNSFCDKLCFAESIDNVYIVDLKKLSQKSCFGSNDTTVTLGDVSCSGWYNDYDEDLFSSDSMEDCYQNINFFGKVAGLDFQLDDDEFGEVLNIGISDSSVGGILRYRFDAFQHSVVDHEGIYETIDTDWV